MPFVPGHRAPIGQPVYLPGGTPVAAPGRVAPPQPFQPAAPTTAGLATGTVPVPREKTIRLSGQPLPPKAPSRLVLPTPEALGIEGTRAATTLAASPPVDWNLAHQRLKELGAVGFHLDRPSTGQVRVTFWLPTAEPGRTQLIESTAASEGEAVNAALHQAYSFRVAAR